METCNLTIVEAQRELCASIMAMDVDDLAHALSEHGFYEDKVIVVSSPTARSYAYLNGMSSDKRGDVFSACVERFGVHEFDIRKEEA